MLILYFYIFQRGFTVLNATLLCMSALLPIVTICTAVRKFFDISLVVKLLIYIKKMLSYIAQ